MKNNIPSIERSEFRVTEILEIILKTYYVILIGYH